MLRLQLRLKLTTRRTRPPPPPPGPPYSTIVPPTHTVAIKLTYYHSDAIPSFLPCREALSGHAWVWYGWKDVWMSGGLETAFYITPSASATPPSPTCVQCMRSACASAISSYQAATSLAHQASGLRTQDSGGGVTRTFLPSYLPFLFFFFSLSSPSKSSNPNNTHPWPASRPKLCVCVCVCVWPPGALSPGPLAATGKHRARAVPRHQSTILANQHKTQQHPRTSHTHATHPAHCILCVQLHAVLGSFWPRLS